MVRPVGSQPLADLSAAWGLAALRAYFVVLVTINTISKHCPLIVEFTFVKSETD
jgi:hypothetical protein